ncbi:hypothetical protein EU537_10815 [Candidatus Thorarchaeota archaeon]|nr:MAG: hypothetical protein EU537_10815 [Candidatus Thorarchaeota archaeon]
MRCLDIMKSLVLTSDGLELRDTPKPAVMPGYARIEVRSVGICRSDIRVWQGDIKVDLPIILGHEITGTIQETSVRDLAIGTPVTTEVNLFCGRCWYCSQNQRHLCPNRDIIGLTVNGGLAEYISVPVELLHVLPEDVDTTIGTFIEPLSSAIQTYRRVPAKEDEPVLVVGSGKVGLLVSQVYDAFGADVYLLGQNLWQLGLARTLGLRNTLNTDNQDWKSKILSATNGVGPRVVVDCSGTPSGFNTALELVRSGGHLALMSTPGDGIPIDTRKIVKREITLVGNSSGSFDKAIDMLAKGRIEVNKLVSREFALEDGAEAFENAAQPEVAKVIIHI